MSELPHTKPDCTGHPQVSRRLVVNDPTRTALAGAQMKFSAQLRDVLSCSGCDLSLVGQVEGGELAPDGVTYMFARAFNVDRQ